MGNKIGRKKIGVAEEYTKPRGIHHQPCNVDYKKLRRLIRAGKLAPCFPGQDEQSPDLDECPICFYYFPSLNRSRCCSKSICTECFLQMKPQDATRPAQCPFCKSSGYAVKYHGARTQEERSREIIEEQKVIEAKIRMQFQDQQDLQHQAPTSSEADMSLERPVIRELADPLFVTFSTEDTQAAIPASSPHSPVNREFGADPEEIMLREAIWLSLQEHPLSVCASQKSGSCSNNGLGEFIQRPNWTRLNLTDGNQGQVPQEMLVSDEDACGTATASDHDKVQHETLSCNLQTLNGTVKDLSKIKDGYVDPGKSSNSTGNGIVGPGILEIKKCSGGALIDESPMLDSSEDTCITLWSHRSMSNSDSSSSSLNCNRDHCFIDHDLVQHHGLQSVLCNSQNTDVKTTKVDALCGTCNCDGLQNYPSLVDESETSSTLAETDQLLECSEALS
ncbi:E3 ubiquitin-protein ligase GW2-like [Nymphaea colorata]|nr:E3 ubiquitin-protein ligase GW2-like [Nymphaea colorata]